MKISTDQWLFRSIQVILIVLLIFGFTIKMGFFSLPGENLDERSGIISTFAIIYAVLLALLWIYLRKSPGKDNLQGKYFYLPLNRLLKASREILSAPFKPRLSISEKIILFIIFTCGLILRLYFLNQPMRYDESVTAHFFLNVPVLRSFHYLSTNNHVLHTLAARFFVELFGNYPVVLRLPAFLAGVCCMPLIFYLSRKLYGSGSGFAAISLMAVYPMIVLFDTQARGYSMLNLFTLTGIAIGLSIIEKPSSSKTLLLAINNALGLLTLPTFIFAAAGLYLWISFVLLGKWYTLSTLLKKMVVPSGLLLIIFTFIFYTPVIICSQGLGKILSNTTIKAIPWVEFLNQTPNHLIYTIDNLQQGLSNYIGILVSCSSLLGILVILYKKKRTLFTLIFSFILGAVIVYFLKHSIPFPRSWVYFLPLTFIVIDAAFSYLSENLKKGLQLTILSILTLLVGFAAIHQMQSKTMIYYNDHGVFTEAEQISEYLAQNMRVGDELHYIYPVEFPVRYYNERLSSQMKKTDKGEVKFRHFYIYRPDMNEIENYNKDLVLTSDTLGRAVILISKDDSFTISRIK